MKYQAVGRFRAASCESRANLIEQMQRPAKPRGSYRRQGDDELLEAIRQLTDAWPTYGYRRITALIAAKRHIHSAVQPTRRRHPSNVAHGCDG